MLSSLLYNNGNDRRCIFCTFYYCHIKICRLFVLGGQRHMICFCNSNSNRTTLNKLFGSHDFTYGESWCYYCCSIILISYISYISSYVFIFYRFCSFNVLYFECIFIHIRLIDLVYQVIFNVNMLSRVHLSGYELTLTAWV